MAILAQWWVSCRLFLSYDKLQNPHTHPERANTLIKYKIIYHVKFISVSYFQSFWQVLSNLKNEWIFPKRGWMVWCLPQASFHYRQRSGCHETLIIKSSTTDWQAAGVLHSVTSLFCTFIIFFCNLRNTLMASWQRLCHLRYVRSDIMLMSQVWWWRLCMNESPPSERPANE